MRCHCTISFISLSVILFRGKISKTRRESFTSNSSLSPPFLSHPLAPNPINVRYHGNLYVVIVICDNYFIVNSFFAGISSTPFMPSAAKSVRRSHRNYGNTESSSSPSPYCDTPNKVMVTPTSIFDCYYM